MRDVAAFYGDAAFARRCIPILRGALDDAEAIEWLGGVHGTAVLAAPTGAAAHWPRVWAARALRYVWDERATAAVVEALDDPNWRVREMAAKVCRRRDLGQAGDVLATMSGDDTPRVRAAVAWALGALGEGEHAAVLIELRGDPDPAVRERAGQGLGLMARRLDRDFD
jgi:HEAT repeat protein